MANTRAVWARDVPDLYGRLDEVSRYLGVADVSRATGLSVPTIEDSLSRPPVTKKNNPLSALSRPAARVGNAALWSHEQVAKACELRQSSGGRYLGGGTEPLETIDAADADARGYISTNEIAEMVRNPKTGKPIHEQTVRRWARDNDDFPAAMALRARSQGHPGVPIVVYDAKQIRKWLIRKGHLPEAA